MKSLHPTLIQQVEARFGSIQGVPPAWMEFLGDVDRVYREKDEATSEPPRTRVSAADRRLVQAGPDTGLLVDANDCILDCKACPEAEALLPGGLLPGLRLMDVCRKDLLQDFLAGIAKVRAGGRLAVWECSATLSGVMESFEARAVPVPNSEGDVLITLRNTTRCKQFEERFANEEERLRAAVELSGIGIFGHDHRTEAVYMSPELREVLGFDPTSKVTLQGILDRIHPEDRHTFAAAVQRGHDPARDGRFHAEHRVVRPDGTVRWVVAWARTSFDGEGERRVMRRTVGAVFDITKERESASQLRESEERLRLALAAANQGLYDLNVQTGEAVVSPEYAAMLGYEPGSFHETHENWLKRMHPEDGDRAQQLYSEYLMGRKPDFRAEFRQKTKDGRWKWILSIGKVVSRDSSGSPLRMTGTHTDISDRKRMEEALTLNVERFCLAMEAANDGLWDWYVPTNVCYVSPRFCTMLGYELDSFHGGPYGWLGSVHPDDREGTLERLEDFLAGKSLTYESEFRMRRGPGGYAWILSRARVVQRDADGHPIRVVGIHTDVTERKQARERLARGLSELEIKLRERNDELAKSSQSLRSSEERLKLILENIPAGVAFVDPSSEAILEVNPEALAMSGYEAVELMGKPWQELFRAPRAGSAAGDSTPVPMRNARYRLRCADHCFISIIVTVLPVELAFGKVLMAIFANDPRPHVDP